MRKEANWLLGLAGTLLLASGAQAEPSNSDLAKATQNPIANMISLPFQNNTSPDWGVNGDWLNTLNIQPVLPVKLNDDWNLVTRTIVPLVSQPARVNPDEGRETGLGNSTFTGFFVPAAASKLIWGVGPIVYIPTATDDRLGGDSWGAGASVIVMTMPGNWVIGGLISQIWDIGSASEPNDEVDFLTLQPIINYNLADGWYLTSVPIITRDGTADSGEEWLVPLGGGAGKAFRVGRQAMNFNAQAFYNVVRPEEPVDVGRWSFRLQLQFMFPK
jgi:hypothetical protein